MDWSFHLCCFSGEIMQCYCKTKTNSNWTLIVAVVLSLTKVHGCYLQPWLLAPLAEAFSLVNEPVNLQLWDFIQFQQKPQELLISGRHLACSFGTVTGRWSDFQKACAQQSNSRLEPKPSIKLHKIFLYCSKICMLPLNHFIFSQEETVHFLYML